MADVSRYLTANDIVNRAAVECGLAPVTDVFASADPSFRQLRTLLTSCGQTLIQDFPWQGLLRDYEVVTTLVGDGTYDLPADYSYMIDQTGWQRGGPAVWPLMGPASPQMWSYLEASGIYSKTLFVWFRLEMGKLAVYPNDPPVDGVPISFQYISRAWVIGDGDEGPLSEKDHVDNNADVVQFEPIMIIAYLKLKFMQSKGFDTQSVQQDFDRALDSWKGKDHSAPILNTGGRPFGPRLLDFMNVPETGYGS